MGLRKTDIIAQLQKDILPLQGFKQTSIADTIDLGLGPIKNAFPNHVFPLGAIHEFICNSTEDVSASEGFIAAILGNLMRNGAASVWISSFRMLFPPALSSFGIDPSAFIFLDLQKQKDVLWTIEEALKCEGLAAVVAEMKDLDFTSSRRFQLAVEKTRTTAFIIRHIPRRSQKLTQTNHLNITASIARWKITQLPTLLNDDLPGVGFPRWNVELLKIRNGKPGSWQVEWNGKRLRHIPIITPASFVKQKKTG